MALVAMAATPMALVATAVTPMALVATAQVAMAQMATELPLPPRLLLLTKPRTAPS